jgi:hypothetical protein
VAHPHLWFYPVTDADHFTVLAPISDYLAKKIAQDTGVASNIQFQLKELNQVFASDRPKAIPKAQFRRQIFAQN